MNTHMELTLHDLSDGHDIAIINDVLPEVYDSCGTPEASMGSDRDGEYSVCIQYRDNNTAGWYYRAALCNIAMWQYKLGEGARKQEAAEALKRRKDELAKEVAKRSDWTRPDSVRYADLQTDAQSAIDMLIERDTKP